MDTTTSLTLLEGLRDPGNQDAWQRFFDRYQPMVMAFAVKLGLMEADAQDASQNTMVAFVEAYQKGAYDRSKGRLRSWLFGIAYRKVKDLQRSKRNEVVMMDQPSATRFLATIPAPNEAQGLWDEEWQRAILRACLDEARKHCSETTVRAFELYVLDEWPAAKVAEVLGMNRNAVFIAKNRMLTRLRELRTQLEKDW